MSIFRRSLLVLQEKEKTLPNYLCFEALNGGTFSLKIGSSVTTSDVSYIEYSIDNGETWTKTNNEDSVSVTITTPSVLEGDKVLWRGIATRCAVNSNPTEEQACTFSSTCNFNVSGHLCSLLYGSASSRYDSIEDCGIYTLARLFLSCTKLISCADIKFPSDVKNSCYRNLFYNCTNLQYAPQELPALKLVANCYSNMFSSCAKLNNAPYILATSTSGNYVMQRMFYHDAKINYVKCLLGGNPSGSTFQNWLTSVASTGVFVKNINATWTYSGDSGVPTNWTIIYYDPSEDKYYTSQDKSQECDDHGNPI